MSYGNLDIRSGSKFLKIESGKPVDIHILTKADDVKTQYLHYDGKAYNECMGKSCINCANGLKREERFIVQVFDRADQSAKEFKFGPNIAIGLREIARVLEMDGQTVHDVDLRISRVSEKPVRYQVVQRKMAGAIPEGLENQITNEEETPF